MDNEEFSPVIDKKRKKKESQTAQFSTNENAEKVAENETSVANDPQVEVNDTASAHAQTVKIKTNIIVKVKGQHAQTEKEQKPKKVKEKHGLKPFAFFSGIFDIVVGLVIVGIGLWICMAMLAGIDTGVTEDLDKLLGILLLPILIVIMGIVGTAGILMLVDGILSIISSFKSDRKNWNGVIVAAAVFDILLFFPTLYMAAITSGQTQIISIVLAVTLVVTFIFKIVEIVLTKRRLKKFQEAKQQENKETYQGPNFDSLSVSQTSSQNNSQTDKKDEKSETGEEPNEQNGQNSGVDFSKLGEKEN